MYRKIQIEESGTNDTQVVYTDKTKALFYAGILIDDLCTWPPNYTSGSFGWHTAKTVFCNYPSFEKNKTQLSRVVCGI